MQTRGIRHLHVYGIDNVMTRAADPAFIGLCIRNAVQCGNKVVWRAHAGEKVGVTAERRGRMCVIEVT
jgi:UDP-N-acetylglucosamine/UDP-N-acetylgalactosamine diphosphorylase